MRVVRDQLRLDHGAGGVGRPAEQRADRDGPGGPLRPTGPENPEPGIQSDRDRLFGRRQGSQPRVAGFDSDGDPVFEHPPKPLGAPQFPFPVAGHQRPDGTNPGSCLFDHLPRRPRSFLQRLYREHRCRHTKPPEPEAVQLRRRRPHRDAAGRDRIAGEPRRIFGGRQLIFRKPPQRIQLVVKAPITGPQSYGEQRLRDFGSPALVHEPGAAHGAVPRRELADGYASIEFSHQQPATAVSHRGGPEQQPIAGRGPRRLVALRPAVLGPGRKPDQRHPGFALLEIELDERRRTELWMRRNPLPGWILQHDRIPDRCILQLSELSI
mmetsp:Transcript_27423/g.64256  ORF Transcript_27423/g.64256 Transcript_27423/m.64256 type:complete len:324 (-) Transcript_27423:50-1021(-)